MDLSKMFHESSVYAKRPKRQRASDRTMKSRVKDIRRATIGSEQSKDSKTHYDLVQSKDPRVLEASAERRAQKLLNSRLGRAFRLEEPLIVPEGSTCEVYRTPPGGYSDTKTLEERNSEVLPQKVEVLSVDEDGKEIVVLRVPAIPQKWPPALKEKDNLLMWASRGVQCLTSLALEKRGQRCHLIVGDEDRGSWVVTRKTESDVMTNIYSIALWGTTDVQITKLDDKTPDHYDHETRTSYEMKVSTRAGGADQVDPVIKDAVKKYAPFSQGGVRVVMVKQGVVWSNYDWTADSESLDGAHTFACCIQGKIPLFEVFSRLFSSPIYSSSRRIEDYGKAPKVKPPDYEENEHDYLKPHHIPTLERLSKETSDGLDWSTVSGIEDDSQDQHSKASEYLVKMAAITSAGNDYLNEDGSFKAKLTSFPLFSYKLRFDASRLFRVNNDCDVPSLGTQREGSTEEALKLLFDIVRKERNPGPGASEAALESKKRWESVDAKLQYGRSLDSQLEIDEEKIKKQIAKLMSFRSSAHLTKDELKSKRASILDKISALVYLNVEKRVKRARKCIMSAPEKIGGSTDRFSGSDCVSAGFLESSYLSKKRAEKRDEERSNPESYVAAQKNLPFVEDPETDDRMELPRGASIAPHTASQRFIEEMGMTESSRDSNYDFLFTMDKVVQEANISLGHKTGPGVFVKPIPYCRAWLLMRNSGQQGICYVVIDSDVHKVDDPNWWKPIEFTTLLRSKVFTISKAKAEMYINAEEVQRVLVHHRDLELREEKMEPVQHERSLAIFSNLVTIILASQRQPDSIILSYARYIGMLLRNNNMNRGPVSDIFGKVERIRSRLSLWALRKFLAWVKDREENTFLERIEVEGKQTYISNWQTKCWLTLYSATSGPAIATSYYVGNIYAKTLGEQSAANRGPMEKLLTLAYKAADGKQRNLAEPGTGVNKIGEELASYTGHYQVDYGLLTHVLKSSWARHIEKHPGWAKEFESEFDRITTRADGQRYATNKSSMEHHSDLSIDGYTVKNTESGRVQMTNIRSKNRTRKMKHMVAKYPKIFLGNPLRDLSKLWTKTRVYMVPKKQLQGKREILILTPGSRLFISSLESIMRALATGMENEVLTNKHKEEKISSYASYINMKRSKLSGKLAYAHVMSRSSADATKWCQLFRMSVFMVMVEVILRKAYPNLADHCMSVLYEHVQKKIQIPPTILREILSSNPFNEESIQRLADEFRRDTAIHNMGECMVKIVDNMLQGILHYTSSVFHSLIQNYFTDRVKELMDEKLMGIALENFQKDDKVRAESEITTFNGRSEALRVMEDELWAQGHTREEIDSRLQDLKKATEESRMWLIAHVVGRKSDKLVPSWDFSYQNAASSDDTSIAMDVIITGPPSFIKKAKKMAKFIFTKVVKAKRLYYMRLGVEESISKSSVGNFRDEMEFNSKWYEGPVVIDVVLKQLLSALKPPSVTSLGLMQTHYTNGRTSVIGVGGTVELVQQIEIAQARLHWKIMGADMSDMFPMLEGSIRRNPHPMLGMFTHEKNPALAGLMPEFMIRYQWLQDKSVSETEQALSMSVDHEMDPTGVVTVSLKIEVGNGLRSKESMMESADVCERFVRDALGGIDPDKYLEENALSFLSGTASSAARLLLELVKDKARPMERDDTPTSIYKLSTLLISAPCISVRLPAESGPRKVIRMSLPAILSLVDRSKAEAVEKDVRLLDTMCENETFSEKLLGLRVANEVESDMRLANRAVSTTRQVMAGLPGELDHKALLFRLWSGSREPEVLSAYKQIRRYLPDVRKTMESSIERMKGYRVDSKMALVAHITSKTDLVYTLRSRGGTGMYTGVYDAIVKVLEVQSYQSKVANVYQISKPSLIEDEGLDQFRFEVNMGAFFPDPERLKASLSACVISDPESVSCPRDLKLLAWAQSMLNGKERKDLLSTATFKTPILISEGSTGRLVLYSGRNFLQINIRQGEKSAVVLSCETNADERMLNYLLTTMRLRKKTWLSWPGSDEENGEWYFNPISGLSAASHPGTTPIWKRKSLDPWTFTDIKATYRKFGKQTKVGLRLTNPGNRWDFVDLSVPTGPSTPSAEQSRRLKMRSDLKAVHHKTMELVCSNKHLTHDTLNEWHDKANLLRPAWRHLVMRAVLMIQVGGISYMRWDDAQEIVNGKEMWRLPAFAGTSFSATAHEKSSPEFVSHSNMLRSRLIASGVSEEELPSLMSEGEANAADEDAEAKIAAFFDDDEDDGLIVIEFTSTTPQEPGHDETFEDVQAFDYRPRSIDITVSPGMPIDTFGSVLLGRYDKADRMHRGSRYLSETEEEEDDEGEI